MQKINVVGAAIRDGRRILAAQRSSFMKSPLKWEFVGGKVEEGETYQQALKREVNEELGITIRVGEHVATGLSEGGDRLIILDVYEADIVEGVPEAREHSQLKWVNISELANLDWAEADIPAWMELVRRFS